MVVTVSVANVLLLIDFVRARDSACISSAFFFLGFASRFSQQRLTRRASELTVCFDICTCWSWFAGLSGWENYC